MTYENKTMMEKTENMVLRTIIEIVTHNNQKDDYHNNIIMIIESTTLLGERRANNCYISDILS